MSGQNDFQAWAEKAELSQDTTQLLVDNGFVSLKSCKRLTSALLQRHFAKSLPLGQLLLLEEGVQELNHVTKDTEANPDKHLQTNQGPSRETTPQEPDPQQTSSEEGIEYQKLMQLLRSQGQEPMTIGATLEVQDGKPALFDPFQFYSLDGEAIVGLEKKVRDIRDYVQFKNQQKAQPTDRANAFKIGDVSVSLGQSDRRVPLERITPCQYMEASMRILREMIMHDRINTTTIIQYVGYVTKIATMAQVFPWQTILKYDQEYRKQQASVSFQWGADSPFLMHLFLGQSSAATRESSTRNERKPSNKYDPATGDIICQKFNGRAGCDFVYCKYRHACQVCYSKTHGEFQHRGRSESQRRGRSQSASSAETQQTNQAPSKN